MTIIETDIKGLYLLKPKIFKDNRGFFLEIYKNDKYIKKLIKFNFVQDNHSRSKKNVLRGLHFQITKPQAQLITVMRGHIFDVVVDLRKESKTFGKWYGVELNDRETRQILMGPGFAHGYYVFSKYADLHYKVTEFYNPHSEGGLNWRDPNIGIKWPIKNPIINNRDKNFPFLSQLTVDQLPKL